MSVLDNIVQVNITRQTTQIDIAAFDIPLLLVEMDDDDVGFGTDRVRTYSSLADVATDLGVTHKGYLMTQKLLGGDIKPATFKIGKVNKEVGDVETYVEALQACIDVDDTWYAVMAQDHSDQTIESLSDTIQAMRKLYFTSTASADAPLQSVETDIGSKLKAKSNDRTVIMYSKTADTDYPECAWVGTQLVEIPGSNTWEYKRLAGVTVSKLTGTEINVLEGKGYNYYIEVKGANITRRGKTAQSEWVD